MLTDEEDQDFWQMMNNNEDEDKSPCHEALDFSPDASLNYPDANALVPHVKPNSASKTEQDGQDDEEINSLGNTVNPS